MFSRRTVLLACSPARPLAATPPCAPTRPASGMSGFWIRQVSFVRACKRTSRTVVHDIQGLEGALVSGPPDQCCPVRPRPADPPCAEFGFWIRAVVVVEIIDSRERSGSRRSKTPEAGALKTPVSKYVAQVAVGAERARGCGGRSAAARALGGAAGALGGASDRVGARIGCPLVGPLFS